MSDNGWMAHFGVVMLLAVIPFAVIACTSFAKVAVVLGIAKNAIGGQGIIPVGVVTALAMVVTLFIMGPVIDEMLDTPLPAFTSHARAKGSADAEAETEHEQLFDRARAVYSAMSPPLIKFLRKNTPEDELTFFGNLDKSKSATATDTSVSVRVLLVAYASNELVEAFVLGVMILIPFLVVDFIVANTLTALGLSTMPAMTVALPMKLLLFIAADGWHLLINALILSYNTA
ncbi:MAG: EscR/YscR/HrcR family type III secretion system export apparatus protein [Deltaproteobacteria bacterium]|nr:EscR/YscR/HrcR family type III secretion system export apparatus protein [Deltaproteobacteria bacterium]